MECLRNGKLILADGSRYEGRLIGAGNLPSAGEVVFNTSMTGYQKVITDPSYAGQIIVMTFPHIGNYGVISGESEHPRCSAAGLVVKELSDFFSPGPGRSSLGNFMKRNGLPGIAGVDTRALTRRIRSKGVIGGAIGSMEHSDKELLMLARNRGLKCGDELVEKVSGAAKVAFDGKNRVAVIDLGIKRSILNQLVRLGLGVKVFAADFSYKNVISDTFDFVVISNGPGDPMHLPRIIRNIEKLISRIPILGICLGHQIAALALGAKTYKMKYGHRGSYQPVTCSKTRRVFITSQNHGYAVSNEIEKIPGIELSFINTNDGTVEGFRCDEKGVCGIQFHPEASPGPHDTQFLFADFVSRVSKWKMECAAIHNTGAHV